MVEKTGRSTFLSGGVIVFGGDLGILLLFLLLTQGGLGGIGGDNSLLFLLVLFMLMGNRGMGGFGPK